VRKELSEFERIAKEAAGWGVGPAPNEYADAPRWSDEEAQLKYVFDRLIGGWPRFYPRGWNEEKAAVEAALHGKPKQLANLIRRPNSQLAPSTWALVAEFVEGGRSPHTGRRKGEAGRPPMSKEQLRERTHKAAEIFKVLRDTLPLIYPKQSKVDIRDRAMSLAGKLSGGVETDTLKNYLDLPKIRRRRPYRIFGYEEE
jgi:hypothetical protein